MADLTNITPLDPNNFSSEVYSPSDESLISKSVESDIFVPDTDYVEYCVYDLNNNKIRPFGNDATFQTYSLLDNQIYIDPENDLLNVGIDTGIVNSVYNFYRKHLASSPSSTYYIKEISSDRTEIRLDSNIIDKATMAEATAKFVAYREQDENFPDFYLNLGSNLLFIANNIKLDTDGTILIKLYEALPSNIEVKTSLWVVEKISNGLAYRVEFNDLIEFKPQYLKLRGPNYNLNFKDELNNSTEEVTLDSFNAPDSQNENQMKSALEDPSIEINVDYTDYSSFVHFSSAESRIRNFYYKLELIQSASAELAVQDLLTNNVNVSASKAELNDIIVNTITTFDGFEYYLYFESSSVAHPKSNNTPPYNNLLSTDLVSQAWVTASIETAKEYDEFNLDYLYYAVPDYIRSDSDNEQYMTFIDMIGHYFDDYVWVYVKDTTNKYDADNRIDYGVSKDLVAQTIRDFGIKLYQNNYSSTDLYSAFLGFTDSGNLFPFPYITDTLPAASGYEYVDNKIASTTSAIPLDDINKRIYKRIYHNLPYLLKKKGTVEGLRTLIGLYGIPDTILRISEFGGKDRDITNDWDYWYHKFNYAYDTEGIKYIESSFELNSLWDTTIPDKPSSVQFRFQTRGIPTNTNYYNQLLFSTDNDVLIRLRYTGTGNATGPYNGAIPDPENEYVHLDLIPDINNINISASVSLPFFDGGWWSVMATVEDDTYTLYAANNLYSGSDGSIIGFIESSSIVDLSNNWANSSTAYFSSPGSTVNGEMFSGSYQEIRYYTTALSASVFEDYTMNPLSFEGNTVNSSPDELAFRATLGADLYTGSLSIHPKSSGVNYITSSFPLNSSAFIMGDNPTFVENRDWVLMDSPAVGLKNRNTDKVRREDVVLPYPSQFKVKGANLPEETTLSNLGTIQQRIFISGSHTDNLPLLEVAFSPQNEINDDIIGQIGNFNIGEYIGDPRDIYTTSTKYPDLEDLSEDYFRKYIKSYDLADFVRLIKYFDNSLFKMVKDFVPARTAVASGIVIKQHILERQKYPQPRAERERYEYTGSIGQISTQSADGQKEYRPSSEYESFPIEEVTGSQGGTLPTLNVEFGVDYGYTEFPYPGAINVSQSWEETTITPLGNIVLSQKDAKEFVNGEFSGSTLLITDGELNSGCDDIKEASTTLVTFDILSYLYNDEALDNPPAINTQLNVFINTTAPSLLSGDLALWWESSRETTITPANTTWVDTYQVKWIAISKTSSNSLNLNDQIRNAKEIKILTNQFTGQNPTSPTSVITSTTTTLEFKLKSLKEFSNSYLMEVDPVGNITATTNQITPPLFTKVKIPRIQSQNNTQAIIEPFIDGIFRFSDCNPLMNNETVVTPSTVYYDVDYSQGGIMPVNFDAIMAGTATKAPIQDYNYYARRSIIPRYSGSKNIIGTYSTTETGPWNFVDYITNQFTGSNAPILSKDPIIADFNWGGGTYPEIANGGGLQLNKILLVGENKDDVSTVAAEQDGFVGSLKNSFPVGSQPVFKQYSTTSTKTTNAKVLDYGWSVPATSNYYIANSSTNNTGNGLIQANTNQFNITDGSGNGWVSNVTTNSSGYEIPDFNNIVDYTDVISTISTSLAKGERWFVTIYRNLDQVASGKLLPLNDEGYDGLGGHGVYEILSAAGSILTLDKIVSINGVIFGTYPTAPGLKQCGCLIWKAVQNNQFILFEDNTLSGVGKGALITSTPSDTIETEFDYITKTYGQNPVNN